MGALQEGIYHASGQRPGNAFIMLFLRVGAEASARDVHETLGELWSIYQGLKDGKVSDLPGHPVPSGALTVLVGFGQNLFTRGGFGVSAPGELSQGRFRSPSPAGGGPVLLGSGLSYAADVTTNPATEEIAVQFIADTQLAVNRALVETWKALHDRTDAVTGEAPLLISGFFSGLQRDDGRSWIDFHDGVSNLRSQDRLAVIGIKPSGSPGDAWVEGGSYMTFFRISVNLETWRRLDRSSQETVVGRDKLTGCAIERLGSDGAPVALASCPFSTSKEVIDTGNESFREPPVVGDPTIRMSHVQRANQHRGNIADFGSARIYRQGFEFLEPSPSAPGFRAGLNFVSFQDTPRRLTKIVLTTKSWLGNVNFGGSENAEQPDSPSNRLLEVRAAGTYLVPPREDTDLYPGSTALMGG